MPEALLSDQGKNYSWLEELTFAYRTAVQSTTGQTPFEMLYGRRQRVPLDIVFPEEIEDEPVDYSEYVVELKERLEEAYRKVKASQALKMDKAKIWYDKRVRLEHYKVGDRVWVKRGQKKKGSSKKLTRPWVGPYRVAIKFNERNYQLRSIISGKKLTVHVNRMNKCFSSAPSEARKLKRRRRANREVDEASRDDDRVHTTRVRRTQWW